MEKNEYMKRKADHKIVYIKKETLDHKIMKKHKKKPRKKYKLWQFKDKH